MSAAREQRYTVVEGCRISYWRWGPPGRPGVVLVHGGGAHAHWWDHIAPWLESPGPESTALESTGRTVVAVDLSGHGDSGHRPAYSLDLWAAEMLAAAEHAGLDGPATLIGHSLGGWATVVAASEHPERVAGLVLVDARVIDLQTDSPPPERPAPRPPRVYATLDEMIGRYRPEPPQDGNLPYVVEYLAANSAREADGGWVWKFDPAALYQRRPGRPALARLRGPVTLVRGQEGLVTEEYVAATRSALGAPLSVVEVPIAGHHMMLDQPLLLVTALRAVLAA